MPTLTKNNNENSVTPTLWSNSPVRCAMWRAGLCLLALFLVAPAHALKVDTHTPEDAILSKGFAAYMDGKDKKALSYFEEVIRINPHNTAAQKGLQKVKVRLKKQEDMEKAKAKKLADAKYKEGRELMKTGDVVAAIDSFHAAIDAVPGHKKSLNELDDIKAKMNKDAKKKTLNLSSWAFARGTLAYLDRDWSRAYRIWSERSRMEPKNIPLANATARAEENFKKMMVTEREDFFRRGARAFYEQGLYKESKNSWEQVLLIKDEDAEALEGKARSEQAILLAEGKGRDDRVHDLLEQGLEYYSNQSWKKALDTFTELSQLDPDFSTAKEYIAKLNAKLTAVGYSPATMGVGQSWRPKQASNQTDTAVEVPDKLENFTQSRRELESQLKRDPTNIRVQQELDRVTKKQDEESDRVYKDGLIAYSQGNRGMAIQYWKQVLVINPDHKKAAAALNKARAEEERTETPGAPQ